MSIRHKSSMSHARTSIVSLYSATIEVYDENWWQKLSRCFSFITTNKFNIYHILERQEGTRTLAYHFFVFALTLISLIFGSISTIDVWRPKLDKALYYGEFILWVFFSCELLIRIWSAGCLPKYRTWFGRLMFISRPVIVVDILTLLSFLVILIVGIKTKGFSLLTLKLLLPLQMIRFLRIDRQLSSWRILKGVIEAHRQELTVTLVIAFMFLMTGSYLVYVAETPIDPNLNQGLFKSMADTMWFSIVTMTTIGYGDLYPKTYVAKMITTTVCFLGVAFWCLPTGIIGSGLAIKVQEQKRDEALSRLVPAAASIIRDWWRLQCAYHGDRFISTWKIYAIVPRRIKHSSSVIPNTDKIQSKESLAGSPPTDVKATAHHFPSSTIPIKPTGIQRKSIKSINDLPKRYVTAVKVIRQLQYLVSCKRFQQAKRPVDIKDVVNENTQMNNRLTSMLNDIQRRLDLVLGTTKTASYLSDEQRRQLSLTARIENVENIAQEFEKKLNYLEQLTMKLFKNIS